MANDSEQLVRQVTEQVLAAMGKTVIAAPIHPPIGTCTGDYSKFPELRGKSSGMGVSPVHGSDARSTPNDDKPLRGIITARHLEGRGKSVRLTNCAKLTPLAADFIRANGISVERGSSGSTSPGGTAAKPAADSTWVWWCDGREPGVERVTGQMRAQLKPLASGQRDLAEVIKKIARRIRDGQASGAVLFVDTAARASCFANRCRSLRAVVGTCTGAVEQGVEQLGANVLIVEHPYHGWKSMRDLIDRFITAGRPASAEVDRQLKELASCD